MVLKNIIINKSLKINDLDTRLNQKVIDKLAKYNDLYANILSFSETINYKRIQNLDPYNQSIKSNILLYKPTEFNGWFSMIDLIYSNKLFDDKKELRILLDADIYGIIDLIKYY